MVSSKVMSVWSDYARVARLAGLCLKTSKSPQVPRRLAKPVLSSIESNRDWQQ